VVKPVVKIKGIVKLKEHMLYAGSLAQFTSNILLLPLQTYNTYGCWKHNRKYTLDKLNTLVEKRALIPVGKGL
jgi:hypothetical protein